MEFLAKSVLVCIISVCMMFAANPQMKRYLYKYLGIYDKKSLIAWSWEKNLKNLEDSNLRFHNIAIGINSGIDVIVVGSALLHELGTTKEIEALIKPVNHHNISSLQELREVFSYFQSNGFGGERFMNDKKLFEKVVTTAKKMKGTQLYIGGNGALMAQTLSKVVSKSVRILYNGPVGPALVPMLNSNIIIPDNMKSIEDEYHLIMEFGKDEKWAGNTSPIASRFIFSHDHTNGKMLAFEKFVNSVKDFHPDLIILAGFHLLEAQEEVYWKKRLSEVSMLLQELSRDIPIHLELASMTKSLFIEEMTKLIFPLVHSIGLNEQELWFVCQVKGGPHCLKGDATKEPDLNGPVSPGIMSDIICWMLTKFSKLKNPSSLLTRIHFHTLPFHIVVLIKSSEWRYGAASVVAGAYVASTQSCGDETVQSDKVNLLLSEKISLSASIPSHEVTFDPSNPIISWNTEDMTLYLTPVLVCKQPVKTVGLGDAISSTGLLYSGYTFE